MHSAPRRRPTALPALLLAFLAALLLALPGLAAGKPAIQGSFIVNGKAAKLQHIRARWEPLDDKGTKGVGVLLSEEPSEGDMGNWRTAEPRKVGDFLYVIFDQNADVWVAELGHTAAKSGRFGVVIEIKKVAYQVKDGKIHAQIKTLREWDFGDDLFTVDLTFDAPIEGTK
jgi:hypothetical protein